jgi:hypothetical protein
MNTVESLTHLAAQELQTDCEMGINKAHNITCGSVVGRGGENMTGNFKIQGFSTSESAG